MREFAKSAFSFSWALSLLGVEQAVNMVRPAHKDNDDVFAPITNVAVNQLDDSLKSMYRFGDNMQKRMLDMAFWWMSPNSLANLSKWGSRDPKNANQRSAPETGETKNASGPETGQSRMDVPDTCCG